MFHTSLYYHDELWYLHQDWTEGHSHEKPKMLKKWSFCNLKASTVVKPSQSRKKKQSYNAATRGMYLKNFTAYYQTYLFRRGLFVLWGDWGERKREHAGHSHRPPRAFYFFHHCYFYRDTQWEPLWRRELPDLYRWWGQHCIMTIQLFWHVFLVVLLLLGNA